MPSGMPLLPYFPIKTTGEKNVQSLAEHFRKPTPEEERLLRGEKLDMSLYRPASDEAFSVRSLLPVNRAIMIRQHTRFCAFPWHRHDYVEVMFVLSGSVTHHLENGEEIRLGEGELLFMNRFVRHSIEPCGAGDIAVNFIVQPEFFDFALEMVGPENALGRFLLDALRTGESGVPYLYFRIRECRSVQSLLESMIEGFLEAPDGSQKLRRLEMGLLFVHLLGLSDHMQLSTSMTRWNNVVVELLNEVHRSYASFELKALARRYHTSSSYLSRLVRENTGHSLTELLWRRRMEKAAQLLRDTDMPILAVSQSVGYENSSYFYRLFERRYGMPPREYRHVQRGGKEKASHEE